ncbi:hypothetical protein GH714_033507 [Hevea brasiliensis]|uniref:Reverse transcriptase zinc-binding domain-containing protein n=1 Tax=Hevea brasiliensis TaxID=3981 RepID=A0A6A6N5Y0_HEVBR|nr:hypothetical protein GH714_033507 [Hevea brasiliensis]
MSALPLLKLGCGWCVGDGSSISIWHNPWLPSFDNPRITSEAAVGGEDWLVNRLIKDDGLTWEVLQLLELHNVQLACMLLRVLWRNRNDALWQGKRAVAPQLLHMASSFLQLCQAAQASPNNHVPLQQDGELQHDVVKWHKPLSS